MLLLISRSDNSDKLAFVDDEIMQSISENINRLAIHALWKKKQSK
jgi:hypothetical protein